MRDIDNTAFNRELHRRIEMLRATIENNITPENIKYFDSSILRKSRVIIGDDSGVRWGDNANVNGVEMSKPRQGISHLVKKGQSIGSIPVAFLFEELDDVSGDGYHVAAEQTITIPKDINEDNTFPVIRFARSDTGGVTDRKYFDIDTIMQYACRLDWKDGILQVKTKYRTYRKPGIVRIVVDVYFEFTGGTTLSETEAYSLIPTGSSGWSSIFGHLLYWRYE